MSAQKSEEQRVFEFLCSKESAEDREFEILYSSVPREALAAWIVQLQDVSTTMLDVLRSQCNPYRYNGLDKHVQRFTKRLQELGVSARVLGIEDDDG